MSPGPKDLIHARFEAIADRAAEALALLRPDAAPVTYGALNRRANQIAHALLRHGTRERRPEAPFIVAVRLPPGPDFVASLLAVLKAGDTFLALDAGLPPGRLSWCLEHATPAVILASAALPPAVVASLRARGAATLLLDELGAAPGRVADPGLPLPASTPAYLIYTSGSTGRPKGILCDHYDCLQL